MAFILSGSQRMDPFTGRPEWDNDFHFRWARECQFEGHNVIDKSAREHGKTSLRAYVGVTVEIVNNPDLTVGIFSFEKAAAERTGSRLKDEWASNIELKAIWDDVFYDNPEKESPRWSMEKGIVVKRSIVSATPSVGWYSISELPTGSRLGLGILDDIETEKTVSTEEMRNQTRERVRNCFNLGGRACRWIINGTHHSSRGIIHELEESGGWQVRCHKAEDETVDPPDIAALYDECDGMLPVREDNGLPVPLPPEVRNVRLAGMPVYLHPLECALKRLRQGNAVYAQQNQGDPFSGQDRRLDEAWIRHYDVPARVWARGANLYITIDPSKGQGDPTWARVDAAKSDETLSWVGGLRRKLTPSQFAPAIYQLAMEWVNVGRLIEIRVEEFGQSTWSYHLRKHFDEMNSYVCRIVSCARHNTLNKESSGRLREWQALEPAYRTGKRLWPSGGIWVSDENSNPIDLCDYYLRKEYGQFPVPVTDDGLAAETLLAITKGRNEDGSGLDLSIEYPESDDEHEMGVRSAGRWGRYDQDGRGDENEWMYQ